ncbi:hypothetical protein QZM42_34115 [Burkholderia vietnamiensis]|uniref:hypothetical protein n=1 Tax=Burkholderia vietnamiensis TaxID=60552 RepID=UPI001CF17B01|nr:hypothetical protein [Burkholderia vietnamiensis]MCA8232421.1 hypothetical protein [Burkholderia vietnamiensis]MDN7413560.1 hypothetical protein [Burkholderia vietnamiensis]MDN7820960.1 hypothetical protein [Burkholderia vietnamiensis]HDR9165950.1 hypothetical protein [Burkholderia vietnamiensis]
MRVQYPLSEAKHARILAKAEKAVQRRMKIRKRSGMDVERAARWWALWMTALGVRQFPKG